MKSIPDTAVTSTRSSMQETQLLVSGILRHGAQWHSQRRVLSRTESGWRVASFAEVARNAARLAHALSGTGVARGDRVASFMWNNQEHLETYLAVPAMGAVLHTVNVRLFAEQIVYTMESAADRVVIVDADLAPAFADVLAKVRSVELVVVNGNVDASIFKGCQARVVDYETFISSHSSDFPWPEIDERDAASICFTTGTTGNPKGVAYSHRSIALQSMSSATTNALRIGTDDRMLIAVPMFHANAWGYPYTAFWFGADMVLLDRFLSPATIVQAIEEHGVTFANGVPTIWNDVLAFLRQAPEHRLSSLDRIVIGGAAVTGALLAAYDSEVGVPIVQGWGMTESSPLVAVAWPPAGVEEGTEFGYRLTQGRVLAGVEIRLVDPDTSEVLPADGETVGEFELRGPWIAGEYLHGDGEDRFHDGWLRTGDVGTLDPDGYVRLTDRAKDVIKSGGEWVSSVALEAALMGHPDILDVAVIGVPDPRWDERPCAVVVLDRRSHPDAQALREWLVGRVSKWWIPERWIFVEEIPRTSVGKYDKKLLRRQFAEGAFTVSRADSRLPGESRRSGH